jgi:oligo-1,6-glucosidase
VQWSGEANAGFTTGKPWFYVNENYVDVNVADQENDPDSVLNFYRKAIALRKELSCVRHGSYREFDKLSSKLYTYAREDDKQKILVICSYTEKKVPLRLPDGFDMATAKPILQNYKNICPKFLKPFETRIYLWEKA